MAKKFSIVLLMFTSYISIMCLARVAGQSLYNPYDGKLTATNTGFVVLLATANILFSWARSIEDSLSANKKELNTLATHSIFGSILFILGSLTKYSVPYVNQKWATPFFFTAKADLIVLYVTFWILLSIALLYVMFIIGSIIIIYASDFELPDYIGPTKKGKLK